MKQTRDGKRQVVIAGGGASGMCAAILLARGGLRVTVLEKGKETGKKLSMTGNGRGNLSNLRLDETCYYSDDRNLVGELLSRYGVREVVSFFRSIGVPLRSEEGYLYPVSGEAGSVVYALRNHMEKEGVTVCCGAQVKEVERNANGFLVKTTEQTLPCDAVVLATGGMAGPKSTCSDGDGYYLAEKLGLRVTERFPALGRLLSDDATLPKESGVRITAALAFFENGKVLCTEQGEVQLTKDAVSGIPVLQASAACAQALAKGSKVSVVLDLFPFSAKAETDALIREKLDTRGSESMRQFLNGFANGYLNEMVLEREGMDPESAAYGYPAERLEALLQSYRCLEIPVRSADSFRQAQATRGGVCLSCLTGHLEAKGVPGLYITGELCNTDGRCGGYNLHWAWSSAMAVAEGLTGFRQETK